MVFARASLATPVTRESLVRDSAVRLFVSRPSVRSREKFLAATASEALFTGVRASVRGQIGRGFEGFIAPIACKRSGVAVDRFVTAQQQFGREGARAVRAGERSLPAVGSQVSVEAGSREKRHRAKVARITEVTCCFQAIRALI